MKGRGEKGGKRDEVYCEEFSLFGVVKELAYLLLRIRRGWRWVLV